MLNLGSMLKTVRTTTRCKLTTDSWRKWPGFETVSATLGLRGKEAKAMPKPHAQLISLSTVKIQTSKAIRANHAPTGSKGQRRSWLPVSRMPYLNIVS